MKFLIYTVLTSENKGKLERFLLQMSEINLPIEIGVYDCRKKKFDEVAKLLKKQRNSNNLFTYRVNDEMDAHKQAIHKSKTSVYGSTVFIDLGISEIREDQLANLIVRAFDWLAVVPMIVCEKGIGCEIAIQTKTDFVNVLSTQIDYENDIVIPDRIFAYNATTAQKCKFEDYSEGQDFELYRLFVRNNVRFKVLTNLVFPVED